MDTVGKLGKILIGMNRALGEIPVTVKLRTGVKDGKNTAHKLMPRLSTEWNAGCITVRSTILIYGFIYVILFSCTAGQDNSVIRDLLTGTISNTASKLFAQGKSKRIVRISTCFSAIFLVAHICIPKYPPFPYLEVVTVFPRRITGHALRAMVLTA